LHSEANANAESCLDDNACSNAQNRNSLNEATATTAALLNQYEELCSAEANTKGSGPFIAALSQVRGGLDEARIKLLTAMTDATDALASGDTASFTQHVSAPSMMRSMYTYCRSVAAVMTSPPNDDTPDGEALDVVDSCANPSSSSSSSSPPAYDAGSNPSPDKSSLPSSNTSLVDPSNSTSSGVHSEFLDNLTGLLCGLLSLGSINLYTRTKQREVGVLQHSIGILLKFFECKNPLVTGEKLYDADISVENFPILFHQYVHHLVAGVVSTVSPPPLLQVICQLISESDLDAENMNERTDMSDAFQTDETHNVSRLIEEACVFAREEACTLAKLRSNEAESEARNMALSCCFLLSADRITCPL
jgi:hypothetical protein